VKISIEFDHDIYTNLFLFANPAEPDPPKNGDQGVKYFGPGYHDAGTINLGSNETVYIAGGAIVRGDIRGKGISNTVIRGRGILLNGGIRIDDSENITVDGIIIIDSPGWTIVPRQVKNSTFRNIKMINKTISSDGINPVGCSNIIIEDVFLRIPDDCISIKALRVEQPNRDIIIRNSVFWSDAAHCILIGPEGNGTATEKIHITNCDFLECQYTESDYWGIFAITNGDDMRISDITIENCRIEDFSHSNLVALRIENNIWTKSVGGPISNIVFRNISYNGKNANPSYIRGYSESRNIDRITFENLQINGKRILNARQGNIELGSYVTNVIFK
jgi:polygalacturonase